MPVTCCLWACQFAQSLTGECLQERTRAACVQQNSVCFEKIHAWRTDSAMCFVYAVGGKQEVSKEIALGMCQTSWKVVLNALSQLLARCSSEEIILHLLKVFSILYCRTKCKHNARMDHAQTHYTMSVQACTFVKKAMCNMLRDTVRVNVCTAAAWLANAGRPLPHPQGVYSE